MKKERNLMTEIFQKLNVLDLFSGIGGFSLGLERAGMKTVAFCEFDKKAQLVLKKHWPDVPIYDDVKDLTYSKLKADGIEDIDVICGGFPCQDISLAGNGIGIEGTRSGLWSDYARLIGEIRPRYALIENVAALRYKGKGLYRVLGDLASLGYDAEWHCIPASAVGAYHERDRIWIVAYPNNQRELQSKRGEQNIRGWVNNSSKKEIISDHNETRLSRRVQAGKNGKNETIFTSWNGPANIHTTFVSAFNGNPKPFVGRTVYGVPRKVDKHRKSRIEQLGNAVVPQIPEIIGRAIMEVEGKGKAQA